MVEALVKNKLIKSPQVRSAFAAVDRIHFVNPTYASVAYQDRPLPTVANVTISAPHMHATMAEIIFTHFQKSTGSMDGKRVLDVGSGSGFLTAVLAELVGPSGLVIGVEHVPELVVASIAAVTTCSPTLAARVRIVEGDGRLGYAPGTNEPLCRFDAIHVGAAAPAFPTVLADQLNCGGIMVVPVGPAGCDQELIVATKNSAGTIETKSAGGVIFVPLTSLREQL
jgi:protein-L-isoaspartate(D-aspartate) O-methyltransferase